jgi:hypothetical protein
VCFTFDDGHLSHFERARPVLKAAGFDATFFISGSLIKRKYNFYEPVMSWEQITELGKDFELGNHGHTHEMLTKFPNNATKLAKIKDLSPELGRPVSYCYAGYHYDLDIMSILKECGYTHARAGCEKTLDFDSFQTGGSGSPYNVVFDNPYNIQCLGIFGESYGYDHFKKDLGRIREHECGVFCFHQLMACPYGISFGDFKRCIDLLVSRNAKVIAMRDIPQHFSYVSTPKALLEEKTKGQRS